ncbi:putative lipoprotein [Parvimonas sp. oral taxon 393 str. F0440]|nr:putative lipoprotein [Parvimonas sp. oral taxon 393 str. F0440]
MSKNLKNKIYKMNLILVCSAILLTSCSKKQEEKEKSSTKKFEFVEKETNYKKDETTEVLIDAEIKKDDIVRSYKHGDHWHVFTKDGKEHITYTDPSKLGDGNSLSLVSVVSKSKLRGLNVTSILKHGDHWHVYTADGKEYLTYENPSSMFPNITVGTYVGSHSSNRNRGNSNNYSHTNIIEEKKDKVVKILRHGDHWHIYTESGKEYISYTDPTSKYPNAEVGEYKGNHGDSQDNTENEKPNVPSASEKLFEARKNLNIVNVLGKNPVDRYDIVKILKHGDHYHIYDSKGNEGITYTNPKSLYPEAEFGEYQGNHGDENKNHLNGRKV